MSTCSTESPKSSPRSSSSSSDESDESLLESLASTVLMEQLTNFPKTLPSTVLMEQMTNFPKTLPSKVLREQLRNFPKTKAELKQFLHLPLNDGVGEEMLKLFESLTRAVTTRGSRKDIVVEIDEELASELRALQQKLKALRRSISLEDIAPFVEEFM